MQKGQKVIFTQDYIDELTRHRDIAKQKYEVENMPQEKSALKQKWEAWEQVLEKAECFQGIVREVKNPEMEKLATVITMEGSEHSLKNLQPIF